ncbi:MAG: DUF2062 domain-containing protein [Acidobacteriota bacterium]
MNLLRRTTRFLLGIPDAPEQTAFAFALGVFLGFSPLLGLHTALGLALAVVLRLNKIAVLVGIYLNNPWIIVPFYGFATWLGLKLTGLPEGVSLPAMGAGDIWTAEFWRWLASQWRLLIPAFVGSMVLCTLLSLIAYPVALYFIRKYRRTSESTT